MILMSAKPTLDSSIPRKWTHILMLFEIDLMSSLCSTKQILVRGYRPVKSLFSLEMLPLQALP